MTSTHTLSTFLVLTQSSSLVRAVQNLEEPNQADAHAVDARQELDLRLGAIFTRFQTLGFRPRFAELSDALISYGPLRLLGSP